MHLMRTMTGMKARSLENVRYNPKEFSVILGSLYYTNFCQFLLLVVSTFRSLDKI